MTGAQRLDRLGRRIMRGRHPGVADTDDPQVLLSARQQHLLAERQRKVEEMQVLARHLGLTEAGALPEDEKAENESKAVTQARFDALRAFPPIPEHALRELERIIGAYGLPLQALSSDKAAFVFRRVLSDYHHIRAIARDYQRAGLFTIEELRELLRVLGVGPWQLAQVIDPNKAHTINAAILRWLGGLHAPTGRNGLGPAYKINRLIEQHVRRKGKEGRVRPGWERSGATGRRLREQRLGEELTIPLASSAQKTERPEKRGGGGCARRCVSGATTPRNATSATSGRPSRPSTGPTTRCARATWTGPPPRSPRAPRP